MKRRRLSGEQRRDVVPVVGVEAGHVGRDQHVVARPHSGLSGASGSCSKTSSAAPRSRPRLERARRARPRRPACRGSRSPARRRLASAPARVRRSGASVSRGVAAPRRRRRRRAAARRAARSGGTTAATPAGAAAPARRRMPTTCAPKRAASRAASAPIEPRPTISTRGLASVLIGTAGVELVLRPRRAPPAAARRAAGCAAAPASPR